jgi:DNA-binding transcriptional LysR family regulator
MMEFELLRSFAAVAECGGFHRAAERLNLTQSTVSQQIKRLELETKRPLFRRTTRTVALTDDGEMLLGDARRLLQLEEAARRRLTAPPLSGTVRLGAVEEVAGGSLPPALGLFASSHPKVKLEVPDRREFAADRAARRWKTGRGTTAVFIAQPRDSAFASAS